MKKIKAKLKSQSGETITEVLVASLVVVLGSILLATMVSAAYRMIRNSEKAYDRYLAAQNAAASRGEITYTRTDSSGNQITGDNTVATYPEADNTATVAFTGVVTGTTSSGEITLYSVQENGGESTPTWFSYKKK